MMASLGSASEAGVMEEARGGWTVSDGVSLIKQAGVRVVRHAAAVCISSAEGTHSASINWVYRAVEGEASGGRPVYKKDGADVWMEYGSARAHWQVKLRADKGKDVSLMTSLGSASEAGVMEETRGGWKVYDFSAKVWKEHAGVRMTCIEDSEAVEDSEDEASFDETSLPAEEEVSQQELDQIAAAVAPSLALSQASSASSPSSTPAPSATRFKQALVRRAGRPCRGRAALLSVRLHGDA